MDMISVYKYINWMKNYARVRTGLESYVGWLIDAVYTVKIVDDSGLLTSFIM
jgi:hypothetical protein